jgi:hypothetical protein
MTLEQQAKIHETRESIAYIRSTLKTDPPLAYKWVDDLIADLEHASPWPAGRTVWIINHLRASESFRWYTNPDSEADAALMGLLLKLLPEATDG